MAKSSSKRGGLSLESCPRISVGIVDGVDVDVEVAASELPALLGGELRAPREAAAPAVRSLRHLEGEDDWPHLVVVAHVDVDAAPLHLEEIAAQPLELALDDEQVPVEPGPDHAGGVGRDRRHLLVAPHLHVPLVAGQAVAIVVVVAAGAHDDAAHRQPEDEQRPEAPFPTHSRHLPEPCGSSGERMGGAAARGGWRGPLPGVPRCGEGRRSGARQGRSQSYRSWARSSPAGKASVRTST